MVVVRLHLWVELADRNGNVFIFVLEFVAVVLERLYFFEELLINYEILVQYGLKSVCWGLPITKKAVLNLLNLLARESISYLFEDIIRQLMQHE